MKNDKKAGQTRIRNWVWTINNPTEKPSELLTKIKNHENVRYCAFQYEIGQKNKTPHFQGYIELIQPKSIKKLNEEIFENKANIEKRIGSQEQAIAYVTDKTKELLVKETFEYGSPKLDYSAKNINNEELPDSWQEQWVHLDRMIENGHYKSLKDVKEDYPYLVIRHAKEIQELIRHHQKIDGFKITPAEVIWIWGESGQGKSCYTDQLLKEQGWSGTEITYLKSDKMNQLWFELKDEENKVLVIEEVRPQWPKYNSLLNWIDRKSPLPVKNSHIKNNFELIVINSLWDPYSLFKEAGIPNRNIIEPLRRIYDGTVLSIRRNEELYQNLKKQLEKNEISKIDFKFSLVPIIEDQSKQFPAILRSKNDQS